MSTIAVIGSGFSGLSAACYMAQAGHEVHVFEKNSQPGGRARQLREEGFIFDMGPSWYWMPDVFEKFFSDFGHTVADFYTLERLDPAFNIVFGKDDIVHIPQNFEELCALFERIEEGSAVRLKKFMKEAEFKYKTGMESLVYQPADSWMEFAQMDVLAGMMRLQIFSSFSHHVRKYFTNPKLIALMEFPVLFLGAMPQETPALYSLMNYAGLKLGTWYPRNGGFGKVVDAFVSLAESLGVHFHFNSAVEKIDVANGKIVGVQVHNKRIPFDGVIASADYHHVESALLKESEKNYPERYWESKTLAPSCLVFYLGLNKKIDAVGHHTLFFDENFDQHAREIYKKPQYPSQPLFYMCCPSKTDATVAPVGHENIFLLMPLAPGLEDKEETRERYYHVMLDRVERVFKFSIQNHIVYKKSYCINDFISDYNSYKGNAYGLANTLMQTAMLKPKIRNRTIKNLYYAGQMTVPGPGVPPAIISGKIAATLLHQSLEPSLHETTF